MKTLAQLKRDLQVGVKVKTIINNCRPEREGEIREIVKAQTNAIVFKTAYNSGESWLWWPKAKDVIYYDNVFELYEDGFLIFQYEIIK